MPRREWPYLYAEPFKITGLDEKDANGNTVVTNVYTYDGKKFCLDIKADAVQTHSPEQAILSAWGRKVKIDETTKKLSLEEEN